MKKKKKNPVPNERVAINITWDKEPNEDRAYNNITVEFDNGDLVKAASAKIIDKIADRLQVKMGNPAKDFTCDHELPAKIQKRLEERAAKIEADYKKKRDIELKERLEKWPTITEMSWNTDMSRFTFQLDNGRTIRVTPGYTIEGNFQSAFSISKPYADQPAVLHVNDNPYWDGISSKQWKFFQKRNVQIAAKQFLERQRQERINKEALIHNGDSNAGEVKKSSRRGKIFDEDVTSVLRTLGRHGMSFDQAKRVVRHFDIDIVDKTISGQLWCGRAKKKVDGKKKWSYQIADLTEKQIDQLFSIAGDD